MARTQSNQPEDSPHNERLPAWVFALVGAAAAVVYLNTLANGFVFDDIPIVVQNSNIRAFSKIGAIFTSGYGAGTQLGFTALYRPIVILSLAANYQLGGLSAWHFHLFNVLVHAANSLLVLLLAFRLTRNRFAAIAAALLFALHPVNTEAVAPVVGRTDLLGTVFALGALLLYAKSTEGERRSRWLLAASLGCLAGGLLSKEHAVTVVGLIMLWDLAVRDRDFGKFARSFLRRLLYPYSLFIGVVCVYLVVRYVVVGGIGVGGTISVLDNPLAALEQPARFFTAGKVAVAYVSRLIAPVTLAHDYSYPQIGPANIAESIGALFVFAVVVWALVHSYRQSKPAFYGVAFFVIGFSIVSNLAFLIGTIMAERLLYMPGVGFCILAGILLSEGRRYAAQKKNAEFAARLAVAVLAVVCVFFGTRTIARNGDWRSQLTLYRQAVQVAPNNAKVRMGYGQTLSEHGDYEHALFQFEQSLKLLMPNTDNRFSYVIADIHFDIANIYKNQGRLAEAADEYATALKFNPQRAETLFNYGKTLYASGRPVDALATFRKVLRLDEKFYEAHNEMGIAHEMLREYRAAEKSYLECIEIEPRFAQAHRNLGLLYVTKLGEGDKAVLHLEKTLELDPDQPDAGKLREALRRYHEQRGGSR